MRDKEDSYQRWYLPVLVCLDPGCSSTGTKTRSASWRRPLEPQNPTSPVHALGVESAKSIANSELVRDTNISGLRLDCDWDVNEVLDNVKEVLTLLYNCKTKFDAWSKEVHHRQDHLRDLLTALTTQKLIWSWLLQS